MATLRSPSGSIIQATGRLEQRLLAQGWEPTDQPATPGARMVTGADLDAIAGQLTSAVTASVADRADLRSIVEPMAVEVDELGQTIEAVTTQAAPKPTPRTDALEAWRTEAQAAIAAIQSTVQAIDVPAAVNAWLTANPPPAGAKGDPGVDGKSAYQIARDAGYGGTQTQWLASLVGAKGDQGDQGLQGLPGVTDYNLLLNKPTLGTAAAKDVGTGATQVILGNDPRLTDARTPTAHTHPATEVTGLGTAASKDVGTGATQVVLGNDARLTDARTPTAHTHTAAQVTGLHAVATSGDYNALANKPTIPTMPTDVVRTVVVNTGALTANTVKNVVATISPAMPNATYIVQALCETATPQNLTVGLVSRTTTQITLAVRSTAAVAAAGINIHVTAIAQ